jgi:hypothetical protein
VLVRVDVIIVGAEVRTGDRLCVGEAGGALSSLEKSEGLAAGLGAPIVTDGIIVGVGSSTPEVSGSTAIIPLQALINKSTAKAKTGRVPIVLILA